jgi:SAM-dependent methyltransferase
MTEMMQTAIAPFKAMAAYPRYLAAEIGEFFSTVSRYYSNPRFRRADFHCFLAYLMRDPDAICHRYLRNAADDEVQKIYGETFFTTLEKIADAVGLSESDVIYDLGCGRGRSVFWFHALRGCRAIGVDINPYFVIQARRIQRKADIEGVDFFLANVLDIDYDDATVIYLYGTAFSDAAIVKLVRRFASLATGTRVVSVSYPLNTYAETPMFELEKTIKGKFPWGETEIYIQRKL